MNVPLAPSPQDASPEVALGDAEFRDLARFVHAKSGIVLTPAKRGLVVSRLNRRLRELRIGGFDQYCRLLRSEEGAAEHEHLISALTTNVTRFFREAHHFAALRDEILPPLVSRARHGGRVRLWSAGCSTGEEPYSIAMELLDLCPEARAIDIRILASDIDSQVIATASEGRYAEPELAEVPEARRQRYFVVGPGARFEVSRALRDLVTFVPLNLIGAWPIRGMFDVIFCRNVVIYFDAATQEHLWRRFAATMPAGGVLCIGHSERLGRSAEPLFVSTGITQYRRTSTVPETLTPATDTRGVSA